MAQVHNRTATALEIQDYEVLNWSFVEFGASWSDIEFVNSGSDSSPASVVLGAGDFPTSNIVMLKNFTGIDIPDHAIVEGVELILRLATNDPSIMNMFIVVDSTPLFNDPIVAGVTIPDTNASFTDITIGASSGVFNASGKPSGALLKRINSGIAFNISLDESATLSAEICVAVPRIYYTIPPVLTVSGIH